VSKNPEHNLARGFSLGLSAYLLWGSFPLIISMLGFASPYEIVVWRIVFGFLTAATIISVTKTWVQVRAVFSNRANILWIITSASFIFINWLVYVVAVAEHHVVEAALGYFINPLVTILLAVFFLGEKLSKYQWFAVAFGVLAVIVLTIDYGRLPWIALTLALSFGIYGLAKNKLGGKVTAVHSFAIESGFVLPIALVQLWFVANSPLGVQFGEHGWLGAAGLSVYGVLTAIPLILFGAAAQYLPLRFIGFMQYLTPIIQMSLGLLVFHEPIPAARWAGFALVWIGLVALVVEGLKATKRAK
jgi:chloramphenicol-sensitive protein RarD